MPALKYMLGILLFLPQPTAHAQIGGTAGISTTHLNAQLQTLPPSVAVETALYRGFLWGHTPKLTIQTGQPVWGIEAGLRIQTNGRRAWQAWQRYPSFGVSAAYFELGERAHGAASALFPHLSVPVLRSRRWLAAFRVGTGLGYVARPYDYFSNPDENAIGSHWNNFTQFRLSVEHRLNPHWRLQAGGAFSHFSNGGSALPNYGVNLPAGFAALAWSPGGIREEHFLPPETEPRGGKRWGGIASVHLARIEYAIIDGPRYPVWGFSGAGYFQINRVNRLLLGAEYEYNRAVYAFGLRTTDFKSKNEARRGATRLAVTVADEFLFGNLGVQVLAGIYTGGGINRLISHPWYSKLTVRYYLPPVFRSPLRCHLGLSLKAHQTTAEMFTVNVGMVY